MPNRRLVVLPQSPQLLNLMTILRDRTTDAHKFAQAARQVSCQVINEAINVLPSTTAPVQTPTGETYEGLRLEKAVCGVSILRAGASMEQALRDSWFGPLSFGKILIQRDEETCLPEYLYSKFPAAIASQMVFLLEPVLATGGSASRAIQLLKDRGIEEHNICFVNIIACGKGLSVVFEAFPGITVVTAAVDEKLNYTGHIVPGLGDFGDRFYNT